MDEPQQAEECTRCRTEVEFYYKYESMREKIVLCDECCKKLVLFLLDYEYITVSPIINFARGKLSPDVSEQTKT